MIDIDGINAAFGFSISEEYLLQLVLEIVQPFQRVMDDLRALFNFPRPKRERLYFPIVWAIEPRVSTVQARRRVPVIRSRLSAKSGYLPWRQRAKG